MVFGFHWQTDGDTDRAVIDKKCNVIRKEITGGEKYPKLKKWRIYLKISP